MSAVAAAAAAAANDVLRKMVEGLSEEETEARAARLLERCSTREDALELRDALVEAGARALCGPLPELLDL